MTTKGLAAAAPAYVKTHSFGEFVFDFSWAQAYAQHGLAYYPKLVLGVPFTPASGARLLVRPDLDAAKMRMQLLTAIREFAAERACSSIHGLFVADADREAMTSDGWLARHDVQFHWHNRGYRDFDHYLEGFTADKRKKARRERRRVLEEGVTFDTLLGNELDRKSIDEVYDLHRDTFLRHGHEPYLTRALFRAMPQALGEHFMVKRARHHGENRGGRRVLLESRGAVRALLGRERATPQPAFRDLLPPGHRVLHRARHCPVRARHAGRTQGEPRIRPGEYLVHALDRGSGLPGRHR
jgi:predicted N-acyltransferase